MSQVEDLLSLLVQLQREQIDLLKRLLGPGVPQALVSIPTDELFRAIEKEFGVDAASSAREWVKLFIGATPLFDIPLKPKGLPPLPTVFALVQTLGFDHHKFTSLSYATTVGKTQVKDLDERLGQATGILPEQIIVSPTTEAIIDFDTKDEEATIAATVPSILAGQALSSPLHPVIIRYQGVTAAGTLKIWAYWR